MEETKHYNLADQDSQNHLVQDDTVMNYQVRNQATLAPYTMEELNARIDESEEQIARGEVIEAGVFFNQVREYIASRL